MSSTGGHEKKLLRRYGSELGSKRFDTQAFIDCSVSSGGKLPGFETCVHYLLADEHGTCPHRSIPWVPQL